MNQIKSIVEKIKSNKKSQRFLIFIVICFIAVFILFSLNKSTNSSTSSKSFVDGYVANLEEKLSKTLSTVKGAGKINVIITVESGMETVLATKTTITTNENGKTERVETPILVNGKTVVLRENYPKIIGVLIVCEGADSIMVVSKIQQATVSLLDINVNQIEILSMK